MSQYSSDTQLKEKFLQFMADQADTKYSVVDNKLNWVLWLYSLIWMPLLVLMCLTRIGRGSSRVEERQQQTAPTGVVTNGYQQQRSAGAFLPGSVAGEQQGLRVQTSVQQQQQQPELSGFSSSTAARRRVVSAGSSLDLPPRYSVPGSFGRPAGDDGDSMRSASASGRSLRSAMSNITERQRQRASSDRVHVSRPSKLQGSSSLPPNVLLARGGSGGSSGSLKGVPGYVQGSSSSKRAMAGYAAADPAGLQGSNSSSGADVRAAPGLDQALAGSGGAGGMWGAQVQQQKPYRSVGSDIVMLGEDAAAADDFSG